MVDSIQTASVPDCPLCGAEGETLYQGLVDRLYGVAGHWSLSRCPDPTCSLIWQNPMLLKEEIGKVYQNYYTHERTVKRKNSMLARRILRIPIRLMDKCLMRCSGIHKRKKAMQTMGLSDLPPGKLLEIGCGRGEKLKRFRNLGWEVTGQEIDPKAAEYVRSNLGLSVHLGELEELGLKAGSYDLIIASHVWEHLLDPVAVTRQCFQLLRPGGRLAITTPNSAGLGHAVFGEHWRGLEPPRHLYIYAPWNLERVLKAGGFGQVSVNTNAAGVRGIFEASFQLKEKGRYSKKEYPETRVYLKSILWQQREWNRCRKGEPVGEELIAVAVKEETEVLPG